MPDDVFDGMLDDGPDRTPADRPLAARTAAGPARHRVRVPRWALVSAVVVVLVGGGAAVAVALTGPGGDDYRTATAGTGDVTTTLTTVGTVAHVQRATVGFDVAGTVAAVDVTVGQTVDAGATLATLDTSGLQQQQAAGAAAVAAAQQTLARDESSQTAAVTTTASSAAPSSAPAAAAGRTAPATTTMPTTTDPRATAALAAEQAAVVGGQHTVDTDLAATQADLAAQQAPCRAAASETPPTTPPSTAPTTAPTTAPSSAPTSATAGTTPPASSAPSSPTPTVGSGTGGTGGGTGGSTLTACQTALGATAAAESTLATAEAGEAAAEAKLGTTLAALTTPGAAGTGTGTGTGSSAGTGTGGSTGSTGGTRTGGGTGGTGTGSTGGGSGSGSGSGSTGPASPARVAADQAAIDAAQASAAVVDRDLTEASLTSPVPGKVAAVSLTPGAHVGAGSSSATVTVVGTGDEEVAASVPLTSIGDVAVGQRAAVTVDGRTTPVAGTVSAVGLLGTTTGSTTTYPVTVALTATSPQPLDGTGASVVVTTAARHGVLTVPTSAVSHRGDLSFVEVLATGASTPVATRVGTGAVGPTLTEVTSGLQAGQRVVVADLSSPLPTATSVPRGLTGRGGGSSGGGGTGGGGGGSRRTG